MEFDNLRKNSTRFNTKVIIIDFFIIVFYILLFDAIIVNWVYFIWLLWHFNEFPDWKAEEFERQGEIMAKRGLY